MQVNCYCASIRLLAQQLPISFFVPITDLMHGVGEEGLEGAPLARRLLLQTVEEVGKLSVLLALRQDLRMYVDIHSNKVSQYR